MILGVNRVDISVDQIRMARTLKRWTQDDLAKAAGISKLTIYKLEREDRNPHANTLIKIKSAFEVEGIEFLENNGIREKPKRMVHTLNGTSGFNQFKADVRKTATENTSGRDICICNVDERLFQKWSGIEDTAQHRAYMENIKDLQCRILSLEGDDYFVAKKYAEYRWLPQILYDNIPIYIYGNKTAIIAFEKEEVRVFIFNHKQVTAFYRNHFERMWEKARPIK